MNSKSFLDRINWTHFWAEIQCQMWWWIWVSQLLHSLTNSLFALSFSRPLSLPHPLLRHFVFLAVSHSFALPLWLSLSHCFARFFTLSRCLPLVRSLSLTLSLSLVHSLPLIRSLTLSLSRSFFRSLIFLMFHLGRATVSLLWKHMGEAPSEIVSERKRVREMSERERLSETGC